MFKKQDRLYFCTLYKYLNNPMVITKNVRKKTWLCLIVDTKDEEEEEEVVDGLT